MALTPADVEQKTFTTALRGYHLDEVDDFLDEVVVTLRDLHEKLEGSESSPGAGPAPRSNGDEAAVGRALLVAQEAADKIVADANTQAEKIIADARSAADTYEADNDKRRAAAEADMAELSRHVADVRDRLTVLATAVAGRLDEMDEAVGGLRPLDQEAEAEGDDVAEDDEPGTGHEPAEAGWEGAEGIETAQYQDDESGV